MPRRSKLALPFSSLVALGLAAAPFACSSDPAPQPPSPVLPFQNVPGSNSDVTVNDDGEVVDDSGNVVGVLNDDGEVVDDSGNVVGTLEDDTLIVDGNVDPGMAQGTGGSANTGGMAGAATGMAGGAGTMGSSTSEPPPGGYFANGAWSGYAWTAIETDPVEAPGTDRTPLDYSELPDNQPFCLSGTVAADPPSDPANTAGDGYQGFAMLGFNVAQAREPEEEGTEPEVGTIVPTESGVAFSFAQNAASQLRLQIQTLNADDPAQRWCSDIPPPDAEGRAFIEYTELTQECYLPAAQRGPSYDAAGRPPIAAVSFIVPGGAALRTPFDFCVDGIADGNGLDDAPEGGGGGLFGGVLAEDFGRSRVRGADGNLYVVQNNAWNAGGPGSHVLEFEGNSFTVTEQTHTGDGQIPISFPSIFVGGNGNQGAAGDLSTSDTDGLPRRINEITSIPSTFNTNAGQLGGAFNATYDIWFHDDPPVGAYDDAEAAFLMVWTHKPGQNPIGLNAFATNVTVAGVAGNWDIWVGPRGENGREQNLNSNAPVISYVSTSGIPDFSADLMAFINDATQRSNSGQLNGFQFPDSLVLTDIFAGFEIWNGGAGLRVSEFTVDVR